MPLLQSAIPSSIGVREAERRQLTLMFCDLVASTALSEQLDPEELREVMWAYQEFCDRVIVRFEGHIARSVGDGLLIYFGYPLAHEYDTQQAVRAGVAILAELPYLNKQLQQTVGALQASPLQVRIGIHTGLVVVGEMGSGQHRDPGAVVGEAPNVAARVQEIAKPNTVVISCATYRLIQGYFVCGDLGPQIVKGISTPVQMYHVLKESQARSRLEVAATTGLTPLVGREEEMGLLLERWEQVKEGHRQVVVLRGEGGIGKSRLVRKLKEQVAKERYTRIEFRCSPYYQHSALYPVIELLLRLLQFRQEDSYPKKLDKLERLLKEYSLPLREVVPLFASLLSLPLLDDRYPPLRLTPQQQGQKTQEALVAWLREEAEKRPVLVVWEDLQWADASSLEFLSFFIKQIPTARIFTLLTCRPEFIPPWGACSDLTWIGLGRLDRKQIEEIIERLAGGKALPAEVIQQIAVKTDGVPLFVEELTKMMLELGPLREHGDCYELTGPLPPVAIPSTLYDSLMARLDQLATVREVVQLGAALGREFSYELMQAVWPHDEAILQRGLVRLVDAELLSQTGFPPQARYSFKYALIRDAAYLSLLRSRRQQYHQQISQTLAERFSKMKEIQPGLLAYDYNEAGLMPQTIAGRLEGLSAFT